MTSSDAFLRPPPLPGQVRRLTFRDFPLYRDHLLRLDAEGRRDRFAHAVGDAFLRAYAGRSMRTGVLYGWVLDGAVRGVAELHRAERPRGDEGEIAFSVEAEHRRQGVGTRLFQRLLLSGRNRGVQVFFIRCLPHNRAMQALARGHGARIVHDGPDSLGRLELAAATPFSLAREWIEDSFDVPVAMIEASRRLLQGSQPLP